MWLKKVYKKPNAYISLLVKEENFSTNLVCGAVSINPDEISNLIVIFIRRR